MGMVLALVVSHHHHQCHLIVVGHCHNQCCLMLALGLPDIVVVEALCALMKEHLASIRSVDKEAVTGPTVICYSILFLYFQER
jgi:hypothetical protein